VTARVVRVFAEPHKAPQPHIGKLTKTPRQHRRALYISFFNIPQKDCKDAYSVRAHTQKCGHGWNRGANWRVRTCRCSRSFEHVFRFHATTSGVIAPARLCLYGSCWDTKEFSHSTTGMYPHGSCALSGILTLGSYLTGRMKLPSSVDEVSHDSHAQPAVAR
jgi:hypothetical protein